MLNWLREVLTGRIKIPAEEYTWSRYLSDQTLGWKAFPVFMTAFSIFALISEAIRFPLSDLFSILIDQYNYVIGVLTLPIRLLAEPLIRLISSWLGLDIELGIGWRHALFILAMYFFIDFRIGYLRRASPLTATVSTVVIGIVTATLASLCSGVLSALGMPLSASVVPPLGFAVYEMAKAPVTANFMTIEEKGKWGTFWYYFLWYGVSNSVLATISLFVYLQSPLRKTTGSEPIVLIIFIFFVSIRNIVMALYKAYTFTRTKHPKWLGHCLISGSMQVAGNLIFALIITGGLVAINAGGVIAGR